jgi:hypothetical protein
MAQAASPRGLSGYDCRSIADPERPSAAMEKAHQLRTSTVSKSKKGETRESGAGKALSDQTSHPNVGGAAPIIDASPDVRLVLSPTSGVRSG